MKYYQPEFNRIICCAHSEISADVWDKSWNNYDIPKEMRNNLNDRLILKTTSKYLPKGSIILDGGCGLGTKVNCLKHHGYKAMGIDYAINTLNRSKKSVPELDLHMGSITDLPYKSGSLDGYWSLGVIEHFWEGYNDAIIEMNRCLKKGGYLFLTFPSLSLLRKLKIKIGCYSLERGRPESFHQFLLNPTQVRRDFEKADFVCLQESGLDGMKGLKDEVPFLQPILQKIYNGTSFISRCTSYGISQVFQGVSRHATLQVYQKKR
ncbi:MAG: class I SAM-dependent methyltransferase [Planctomycetes bacterium]|nr:class I SAM-dependent methyltransferase [Planctomycetota bacterium]